MDKELQDRLRGLQIRLNSQDIFAKNAVCDELLGVLKELEDEHAKNEIRRIIVLPLVDLNRRADLQQCVGNMMDQPDYELNIVALLAMGQYLRRQNNLDAVLDVQNQAIQLTEQYGHDEMMADGYVSRGKVLLELNRYDQALEDFNRAIVKASEHYSYNLVAIARYYTGVTLLAMGHEELGMEKLRDASETAHEQHCSDVAMHTEAYRALKMLEKGRADIAQEILAGWADKFKYML